MRNRETCLGDAGVDDAREGIGSRGPHCPLETSNGERRQPRSPPPFLSPSLPLSLSPSLPLSLSPSLPLIPVYHPLSCSNSTQSLFLSPPNHALARAHTPPPPPPKHTLVRGAQRAKGCVVTCERLRCHTYVVLNVREVALSGEKAMLGKGGVFDMDEPALAQVHQLLAEWL
jgi:hypothetical protein